MHAKRSKTPIKPPTPKAQPVSPTKSSSATMKQANPNKENQPINEAQPAMTLPCMGRQNCQSPALTTIGTYTQRNGEIEQSLKIALELAQYHRREMEGYKAKCEEMEERVRDAEGQLREIGDRNAQLQGELSRNQERYRKLKQKYKELKKEQSRQARKESPEQPIQRAPSPVPNKRILQLQSQIQTKNKSIHALCEQVSQCEQNTQNILKLINILEQRVQQLNMDNSLLKGMLRERQISEASDFAKGNQDSLEKVMQGYERISFGKDGKKRRDIMDYGIVYYEEDNRHR